ncbi:Inner membrane protein YqjE [Candidatus Sodalis pierantonius str. SOPE]|uniref:Inner membrane protein YqjE n=1 Tax=Candidatus Sodalis pierantonii str. SOPE TaxID=2342 RepID=W0HN61_9GAMM|nr:Inner membrane protein YqjE [Candidatus Sodalis pierantonius str. SOPE]
MIEQQNQGPGNGLFNIAQRILTIVVGMIETRLRLAVVELEEEKFNIIQMLMMAGITLLFAAFGLMSLLVLVVLAIDPQYRLTAIASTTGILLLAIVGAVVTLAKARKSSLLGATREELQVDRNILEKLQDEIKNEEVERKHEEEVKSKQRDRIAEAK